MISAKKHEICFIALSSRTRRKMRRGGFETLEDLTLRSEGELRDIYGFNQEILDELRCPMVCADLRFRKEVS